MINVERPFALYCNASINYQGRARSTCVAGNYLVLRKGDGSLLIHGNSLYKPLNYQPPGAIMYKDGNKLISIRNNETILIVVNNIIDYNEMTDWTSSKIELIGNESDYREAFIKTLHHSLIKELRKEYKTPLGAVDLLVLDKYNIYHIYEFKRRKAGLNGCSQLIRYVEYFQSVSGRKCNGYLVAPAITENAHRFLIEHQINFVEFDVQL